MRAPFLPAAAAVAAVVGLAPPTARAQTGAVLFSQNCAACHQADGRGVPGAFPALAGDPFVKGAKPPVIKTLLNGRGGMPRFGDQLTSAQIAAVISHVRASWGNAASPVTRAEVAALRVGPEPSAKDGVQAH